MQLYDPRKGEYVKLQSRDRIVVELDQGTVYFERNGAALFMAPGGQKWRILTRSMTHLEANNLIMGLAQLAGMAVITPTGELGGNIRSATLL
ncbi:hypothetical protein HYW17_03340 [Candidatus Uhrbacteria bacterium]|nr:hypothetical protein [Candidatus Uhrbacteria bacterium]